MAEHVGTKTKAQCHKHYFDVYVHSPTAPLPDMSKVLGKAYERVSEEDEKDSKPKNASKKNDGPDDDENEDDERDPPATTALASFARPGDERHSGNVPELTGYNVKRDEFDPEYDIDAELPLAEMEFRDTDTDLDKQPEPRRRVQQTAGGAARAKGVCRRPRVVEREEATGAGAQANVAGEGDPRAFCVRHLSRGSRN